MSSSLRAGSLSFSLGSVPSGSALTATTSASLEAGCPSPPSGPVGLSACSLVGSMACWRRGAVRAAGGRVPAAGLGLVTFWWYRTGYRPSRTCGKCPSEASVLLLSVGVLTNVLDEHREDRSVRALVCAAPSSFPRDLPRRAFRHLRFSIVQQQLFFERLPAPFILDFFDRETLSITPRFSFRV